MKKVLSLILVFVFVVGICASAPLTIKAEAAVYASGFIPRTSVPTTSDKWIVKYNTSNNCTRYAYARISEILNTDATSLLGTRPGADGFPTLLQNAGYTASSTPTPGSVMCTSGHVAIVESVNASNGTLVVSEGHSWSSAANMSNVSKYLINGSSVVGYSTLTTDGNGNGTWFDLRTIYYTNKSAKYYSLVKTSGSSTISYSTITNGLYYLKNNSTGTYLAVAEGKDVNGQPVNLWNKSESFRVQITKDTNGYVMRFPGVSSIRVVNQYASAPVSGTKVTLYTYSGSTSQSWGFQKVSGGYVIRSIYNQNLCLTANGSSAATVTTYTGASNQIWTLESYCTHSSTTTKNPKSATCTATGYTGDKYCSSCGILVSYGSTTAKLGHSTSVVNKKSATCTSTGYTGDTYCSRCKTTVSKGSTIAKLGHSTSVINKKSATCTSTGYTGDTYCSTCKTTISKGTTIAKTAHKTTVVNAKSATCTSTGYTGDTKCTVCGTVTAKGTTIAKVAHKTTVIDAKAATATTDGYTGDTKCTVCGTVTAKGSVIKATGVVNGGWETESNDTGSSANIINVNTKYSGTIGKPSDCDYYRFTLTQPGKVNVSFSHSAINDGLSYWNVKLCDSRYGHNDDGYKLDKWDISGNNTNFTSNNVGLAPGVYYLEIDNAKMHSETTYNFTVNFTPSDVWESENNGYYSTSNLVNINTDCYGSLKDGYSDTDWYRFTLTKTENIKISFSHSKINDGFSYWDVYLKENPSSSGNVASWNILGNQTSFTTGTIELPAGVYYIKIQSGDKKSSIDYKFRVSTTLATPVVTVKNSATGVKVTWNAVDGATSYKVYRKTYSTKTKKYGGWKTCGTVTTTSYVDTNAKSGTKYIYTVKAFNGDVKSGIKSSSTILCLAQPTVKIANASTGVKVTWNKITGATSYKVYRSEYTNGKWTGWKSVKTIDKGSTVSWTDKNAKSGVKYKYTVKAVNGKTASTYKSSSSLLYLAQPKTTVKAVSSGINVAWTQSIGATSYKIYRSEYNTKTKKWSSWKGIKTAKATSKSYTDKSAKKGVKYRYTVRAVNGSYKSTFKASTSVKR